MTKKKLVVTETLTAEIVSEREPRDAGAAAADAVAQAGALLAGLAPGMAAGEGLLAAFASVARAAHDAALVQNSTAVTLEASTVRGVATLYGGAQKR